MKINWCKITRLHGVQVEGRDSSQVMIMLCPSMVGQSLRSQAAEKCGGQVSRDICLQWPEIKYLRNLSVLWYVC